MVTPANDERQYSTPRQYSEYPLPPVAITSKARESAQRRKDRAAEKESDRETLARELAEFIRDDPKAAQTFIETNLGVPGGVSGAVMAVGGGGVHGASHGFTDDLERLVRGAPDTETGRRKANWHVRLKAAHPNAFALGQLLGLTGTGAATRAGLPAAARAMATRGAGSYGLGARTAAKAGQSAANRAANLYIDDPKLRAMALDAGHGGILGAGGLEVDEDEKVLSMERVARTGLGAAAGAAISPLVVSGGYAASNIPLVWNGRRWPSRRMYEPPGVTKENSRGLPQEAIDLARSQDAPGTRSLAGSPKRPIADDQLAMRRVANSVIAARTEKYRPRAMQETADALQSAYPRQKPHQNDQTAEDIADMFETRDVSRLLAVNSKINALSINDPKFLARVQNAVARRIANQEVRNPVVNNSEDVERWLMLLRMHPKPLGSLANVLAPRPNQSAVALARAAPFRRRYDDAMANPGRYPIRPRHVEPLDEAMDSYQLPTVQLRASPSRGLPLVARGDDKARFVDPRDMVPDQMMLAMGAAPRPHVPDDVTDAAAWFAGGGAMAGEGFVAGPLAHGFDDNSYRPGEVSFSDRIGQVGRMAGDVLSGMVSQGNPRSSPRPSPQNFTNALAQPSAPAAARQAVPASNALSQATGAAPMPLRGGVEIRLRDGGTQEVAQLQQILSMIGLRGPIVADGIAEAPTLDAMAQFAIKSEMPGIQPGLTGEEIAKNPQLMQAILRRVGPYLAQAMADGEITQDERERLF